MNRELREDLYSMLYDVMLSDYEFSRNYRNFLQVSENYFTASAENNRNVHSIINRIVNLDNNLEQRQPQRQRQNNTNTRRYGNFNQRITHNANNLQNTTNPIINRNQETNNTTNFTNSTNTNSIWGNLWGNSSRNSNTRLARRGIRNRGNENSNFITLLSNSLLQNELLNRQSQRERMPTEEDINNV